jgi:hypothetical protein
MTFGRCTGNGRTRTPSLLLRLGAIPAICLLILVFPFAPGLGAATPPPQGEHVVDVIERMEAAYARLEAYQAETEVSEYKDGRVVETKRFLYTFRKPDHVRFDMESPYPGTVLVYPDEERKVSVRHGGWGGILKLHLSPDNALLRNRAGQPIDQTGLGLLVRNIAHSLTDRRRGEIRLSGQDGRVLVEVVAEDHFLPGVLTLYRFSIDRALWLPVEIMESTPDGVPRRKSVFRNPTTSPAIPNGFFQGN